jgi:hypothetical protein
VHIDPIKSTNYVYWSFLWAHLLVISAHYYTLSHHILFQLFFCARKQVVDAPSTPARPLHFLCRNAPIVHPPQKMTGVWRCECRTKQCNLGAGGGKLVSRSTAFRHACADRAAAVSLTTTPVRLRTSEVKQREYDVQEIYTQSSSFAQNNVDVDAVDQVRSAACTHIVRPMHPIMCTLCACAHDVHIFALCAHYLHIMCTSCAHYAHIMYTYGAEFT